VLEEYFTLYFHENNPFIKRLDPYYLTPIILGSSETNKSIERATVIIGPLSLAKTAVQLYAKWAADSAHKTIIGLIKRYMPHSLLGV